jgi:hypothetical protein
VLVDGHSVAGLGLSGARFWIPIDDIGGRLRRIIDEGGSEVVMPYSYLGLGPAAWERP